MASYRLQFRRSFEKDLRDLPKEIRLRVLRETASLKEDQHPRSSKKLATSESKYRLRVGAYRVLYEINNADATVILSHVLHRKDAYR